MLRGLHDTKLPMIYAAIGYWGVGLPLGVVLAFNFGFNGAGIWIGLSSGLAVVAGAAAGPLAQARAARAGAGAGLTRRLRLAKPLAKVNFSPSLSGPLAGRRSRQGDEGQR